MKKLLSVVCTALLLLGCLFAENKVIQVLSINDFHGSLAEEAKEKGKNLGMSKLVSQINIYKDEYPNTIVVSAGDNYQGSAMSNLTYGAPVSAMFKEMGVFVSAVGNHEFDWGIERTKKWQRDGKFKFVAANIVDKTTGKPVKWAVPYAIKKIDGVKVAFIGLTTPQTAYQTSKERVQNYEFEDVKETAEKWAKELKSKGKADIVIALTHVGSGQDRDSKDISGEVIDTGLYKAEGIDAIISGHSHQTVCGVVDGMPIIQAYKYGRCVGRLIMTLDENNNLISIEPKVETVYQTKSSLIEDPRTKEKFEKFEADLSPIMDEKVGYASIDLSHDRSAEGVSVLGYLVSDIMRDSVDAQVGIANSGGIRGPIAMGDITMGKMYEILPFDNTVVKMTLTGEQLKRVLNNGIENPKIGWVEVCGVDLEVDMSRPFGDRIINMYLEDGTKIGMDDEITVATIDFIFTGGDMYDFSGAKDAVDTFIPLRDVIVNTFKTMGPINFDFVQPIIYLDGNSQLAS